MKNYIVLKCLFLPLITSSLYAGIKNAWLMWTGNAEKFFDYFFIKKEKKKQENAFLLFRIARKSSVLFATIEGVWKKSVSFQYVIFMRQNVLNVLTDMEHTTMEIW